MKPQSNREKVFDLKQKNISNIEISKKLGITEGSVKTLYCRERMARGLPKENNKGRPKGALNKKPIKGKRKSQNPQPQKKKLISYAGNNGLDSWVPVGNAASKVVESLR